MRKTHGFSTSKTYASWCSMKWRCYCKSASSYPRYGGRGIRVCNRWVNSFENFLEDMGVKPKGLTLERIDNECNYDPSNCVWANRKVQARNRPGFIVPLTLNGKTQLLSEWANELGIGVAALHNRINLYGWTVEEALSRGKSHRWSRQKKHVNGI